MVCTICGAAGHGADKCPIADKFRCARGRRARALFFRRSAKKQSASSSSGAAQFTLMQTPVPPAPPTARRPASHLVRPALCAHARRSRRPGRLCAVSLSAASVHLGIIGSGTQTEGSTTRISTQQVPSSTAVPPHPDGSGSYCNANRVGSRIS